jgi:hypothetical protein
MGKAREFHIIKDQIIHGDLSRDWVSEIDIDPPLLGPNQVHVIEISALNKLNQQLELTKAFLITFLDIYKVKGGYMNTDLDLLRERAKAILDRKGEV